MNQDDAVRKAVRDTKENLEESVKEYFDNIEAIKGRDYMEVVKFVSGVSHTAKLISIGTQWSPDHIREAVGLQFAQVAAGGATLIMRLLKLDEDQVQEIVDISERISETIDSQLEQVSKKISEIRKGDDDE